MSSSAFAVIGLIVVRAVAGAMLPASADEAYYWLWSLHPAAGYLDHPPAIAFLIRFGTALFGATPFGIRFGALLASMAATVFVWRSGAILAGEERTGVRAALYYNLTLTVAAALAATQGARAAVTGRWRISGGSR